MKHRIKIYHLLLNHQLEFLQVLRLLGVSDPKIRVKNLLDEQLFEVISVSEDGVQEIKNKRTGEHFKKGCRFYHNKYNSWHEGMYFDEADLFGTYYGDCYYKNYVRSVDGGLYHLDEISLTGIIEQETVQAEALSPELNKTNDNLEDYNVIAPDNRVWDLHRWMLNPNVVDDVSENPYPVMYVDGKPIYEGDKLIFTDAEGNQYLRKVYWQHRVMIRGDKDWINNWSLCVNIGK
jgi:hypothetical protein